MQKTQNQALAAWQRAWTVLSHARELLTHAAAQASAQDAHEDSLLKTAEGTALRTDRTTDTVMDPVEESAQEPIGPDTPTLRMQRGLIIFALY